MQLSHPKGFYVLFLTEMWERFGFYLMRALLVLYLVKKLGYTEAQAAEWFGWYLGAVYLTPIPGGLLTDRLLGSRRATQIGAAVMMVGHLVMAIERRWAALCAMGMLAIGGGLFKPSMQAQLSKLYATEDGERHDRAFSLFYIGINLGALLSPLAGWWLQKHFGWSVAFGSAGAGLLLGQITYQLGQRWVVDRRSEAIVVTVQPGRGGELKVGTRREGLPRLPDTGRRIAAVFGISLLTSLFWASYSADGGILTTWAKTSVKGFEDRAALTAMINPACILLLSAPIAWLLGVWGRRRGQPVSSLTKLLLGYLIGAAAFLPIAWAAQHAPAQFRPLMGFYVLVTIGELLVNPQGTALVAKIAPPEWRTFLLGVWLLSSSLGGMIIGQLARLWTSLPHGGFFLLLGALPAAGALILVCCWKPLGRLLGEGKASTEPAAQTARQPFRPRVLRGMKRAA